MLQQLEAVYDAEESSGGGGPPPDLPTGDEIAAELERYLREQGS